MKTVSLEIWKPIKGFERIYQVSNLGNIRRCKIHNILKPQIRGRYYCVSLSRNNKWKSYLIHRLVAIAFITNKNNHPHVNHIDSNRLNNNRINLEWCTASYNKIHSYKAGTSIPTKGRLNGMHRINRERRLWKSA